MIAEGIISIKKNIREAQPRGNLIIYSRHFLFHLKIITILYFGLMKISKSVQSYFKASRLLKPKMWLKLPTKVVHRALLSAWKKSSGGFADCTDRQYWNWKNIELDLTFIQPKSRARCLAESLFNNKYASSFFLMGLSLAFTLVLPMPLLSACCDWSKSTLIAPFAISFVYVQGWRWLIPCWAWLAAIGCHSSRFTTSYVMIGLSIIFVLLALSMFGVFTLQLPSSPQTKLSLPANNKS